MTLCALPDDVAWYLLSSRLHVTDAAAVRCTSSRWRGVASTREFLLGALQEAFFNSRATCTVTRVLMNMPQMDKEVVSRLVDTVWRATDTCAWAVTKTFAPAITHVQTTHRSTVSAFVRDQVCTFTERSAASRRESRRASRALLVCARAGVVSAPNLRELTSCWLDNPSDTSADLVRVVTFCSGQLGNGVKMDLIHSFHATVFARALASPGSVEMESIAQIMVMAMRTRGAYEYAVRYHDFFIHVLATNPAYHIVCRVLEAIAKVGKHMLQRKWRLAYDLFMTIRWLNPELWRSIVTRSLIHPGRVETAMHRMQSLRQASMSALRPKEQAPLGPVDTNG